MGRGGKGGTSRVWGKRRGKSVEKARNRRGTGVEKVWKRATKTRATHMWEEWVGRMGGKNGWEDWGGRLGGEEWGGACVFSTLASLSILFCALPRGPIRAPKKLYPGYLSTGTMSFRQHRCAARGLSASTNSARSASSCWRRRAPAELTCVPALSKMGSGEGGRWWAGISEAPQSGSCINRSISSILSLICGSVCCCSADMC